MKNIIVKIASISLVGLSLVGCSKGYHATSLNTHHSGRNSIGRLFNKSSSNKTGKSSTNQSSLAKIDYRSGNSPVSYINNNKSTLNIKDWKTNHIEYGELDNQNRTSNVTTAYLEQRNVTNDSLRTRQYVKPTGWHQKMYNHEAIINRGHLIAYSLSKGIDTSGKYNSSIQSGDQNNLRNLFTQTAFANQRIQTIYESKVRQALENGHKVIYQVHVIFRGNELMARGVQLQAVSDDGSVNFNVFIFNVQSNLKFNYSDGTSIVDGSMNVPNPSNDSE